MAKLYWRPTGVSGYTGDPLAWAVARHVDVQAALAATAAKRAAVAEGVLASHRYSGASSITIDKGDVDWYVKLNDKPDEHGSVNAMAIEMGAADGRGGVRALSTAFPGIKITRTGGG